MKRIVIKNFGPIEAVDVNLDKSLTVVIGQQASGKSTFAKLLYFCRKIRDYLSEYVDQIMADQETVNHPQELYGQFLKFLRNPFMGCFGTTKHMSPFKVTYFYDTQSYKSVEISLYDDKYAKFVFSPQLRQEIEAVIQAARVIKQDSADQSFSDAYRNQALFSGRMKQEAMRIFCDDADLMYIPAGRNLLATLSDQIGVPSSGGFGARINFEQTDLITQEFIRSISGMRNQFSARLEEVTENYLKTVKGQIRNADVEEACRLIHGILKADYVCDKEGEKLYYGNNEWVKLMFASSGQQEILWGLNIIFMVILKNRKTFLVFEEPESHLFPDAQEKIAQLVALMINSSKSEMLMTTHSPYMLTALNLLIYSGAVEREKSATPVVKKNCRLKRNAVAAYYITAKTERSGRSLEKLIDRETGLIDALKIDGISESINERMDQLFAMEQ